MASHLVCVLPLLLLAPAARSSGAPQAAFSACGAQIATAFLRAPGSPLPVDCALKLRGADFGLSARPKS